MMTNNEINRKVEELKAWETLIEEAQANAEEIKSVLKEEMAERNLEEFATDRYIIRWQQIISNRFDTTAFKKIYNELYKQYTKKVESRRFNIA